MINSELLELGILDIGDLFHFDRWASNTQAILYDGEMPSSFPKNYFALDMTRSGSLRPVITGFARYRDDPPRYEYLRMYYNEASRYSLPNHIPCTLEIYEPTSEQRAHFWLGADCGGVFYLGNQQYLYLSFPADRTQSSRLYLLDTKTLQRTELLRGEYELLDSVSPDSRYAVVITDSNGQLDFASIDPLYSNPDTMSDPQAVILDLTTGQIVHKLSMIDVDWYVASADINYLTSRVGIGNQDVRWLAADLFMVSRSFSDTRNFYGDSFYRIEGGQIVEEQIGDIALVLPGNQRVILWTGDTFGFESADLYNLASGTKTPIVNTFDTRLYDIYFDTSPGSDTLVTVTISANFSVSREQGPSFKQYVLRLPTSTN